MRIPSNAIIAREKLVQYLLIERPKNDKSRYLAQAGFTLARPDTLEAAIRKLIADEEGQVDRRDEYGVFYQVAGALEGPQKTISVITIWLEQAVDGLFRFVTLKPRR
jgi:hypothetical protein